MGLFRVLHEDQLLQGTVGRRRVLLVGCNHAVWKPRDPVMKLGPRESWSAPWALTALYS